MERRHAYSDPYAPIEQRQYHILLAARLHHARCQSPIASAAMCAKMCANFVDTSTRRRGRVPETTCGWREITGIGPKLAEILMIANRSRTFSSEADDD